MQVFNRVNELKQKVEQNYGCKLNVFSVYAPNIKSEAQAYREGDSSGHYTLAFKQREPEDYVIVHELAHVVCWEVEGLDDHDNHGKEWMRVYEELEDVCGLV